jgi:hypothetical protein
VVPAQRSAAWGSPIQDGGEHGGFTDVDSFTAGQQGQATVSG